ALPIWVDYVLHRLEEFALRTRAQVRHCQRKHIVLTVLEDLGRALELGEELNLLVHLGGEDFGQILAFAEPRQVVREEPIRVQAKLFEQAAIRVCTEELLPQSLCSLNLLLGQALNGLTLQVTGDTLTGSRVPQVRL